MVMCKIWDKIVFLTTFKFAKHQYEIREVTEKKDPDHRNLNKNDTILQNMVMVVPTFKYQLICEAIFIIFRFKKLILAVFCEFGVIKWSLEIISNTFWYILAFQTLYNWLRKFQISDFSNVCSRLPQIPECVLPP